MKSERCFGRCHKCLRVLGRKLHQEDGAAKNQDGLREESKRPENNGKCASVYRANTREIGQISGK